MKRWTPGGAMIKVFAHPIASSRRYGRAVSGHGHALVAILALVVPLAAAFAQAPSTEKLEQELVASWLVIVDGDVRSRTLAIREIAQRTDGSFFLDATYGWTLGGQDPVRAEFVRTSEQKILIIRTPAQSIIVAKQSDPETFAGSFTYPGGTTKRDVRISKASDETIRRRVEAELEASRTGPGYSQENRDWGIAPSQTPQTDRPHAPTPRAVPGARTLTTLELYFLLNKPDAPLLIDVLDGPHATIRGAHWMPGAGGAGGKAETTRLAVALEKLTSGDKTKALAFFCLNSECWLSYNVTLRAIELGYRNVGWYRGGTAAWGAANFRRAMTSKQAW